MMELAPKDRQAEERTQCPRCRTLMSLVAVTRHPIATHMQRHTYICVQCNQTKTYVLQA